jgi:hypothetical protein
VNKLLSQSSGLKSVGLHRVIQWQTCTNNRAQGGDWPLEPWQKLWKGTTWKQPFARANVDKKRVSKEPFFGVDHILPEQEGYKRQFLLKPFSHTLKECQTTRKLFPLRYDPPLYWFKQGYFQYTVSTNWLFCPLACPLINWMDTNHCFLFVFIAHILNLGPILDFPMLSTDNLYNVTSYSFTSDTPHSSFQITPVKVPLILTWISLNETHFRRFLWYFQNRWQLLR